LIDIAYAMGNSGGAANSPGASSFASFIPLIIMFVIFYFLLIRPQQKKSKEHREMLNNLKKGDRIVTNGGIHGRITGMDEATLTLEIADKVRVKMDRGCVVRILAAAPQDAKEQG
jgi:preprotein translocase subunit YajC